MKALITILITFNIISAAAQTTIYDNTIDFMNGPKNKAAVFGDSIQKKFFALNMVRIENLSSRISALPIDRCHCNQIVLRIYTDTVGKIVNLALLKACNNAKIDSNITNLAVGLPGLWKIPKIGTERYNYEGNLSFVLLNNHAVRSSKREMENGTNRTLSHYNIKQYDHTMYCSQCDFYYNKGIEEFKKGDYKSAQKSFSKALEVNAYDTDVLFNLAASYLKQNKNEDACIYLQLAYNYGDITVLETLKENCSASKIK